MALNCTHRNQGEATPFELKDLPDLEELLHSLHSCILPRFSPCLHVDAERPNVHFHDRLNKRLGDIRNLDCPTVSGSCDSTEHAPPHTGRRLGVVLAHPALDDLLETSLQLVERRDDDIGGVGVCDVVDEPSEAGKPLVDLFEVDEREELRPCFPHEWMCTWGVLEKRLHARSIDGNHLSRLHRPTHRQIEDHGEIDSPS